ncbi:MAG: fructose-1,6-bisphosphatase [Clostridiales bacterium]|nr:fructose-1,6-bisphosphatase [Clostridiales bacterium]
MIDNNNKDISLELMLKKQYPTKLSAYSEIINLKAILDLPKPSEHFLSDLHGEYSAFRHMLRNSSGLIKNKIEQEFKNTLSPSRKDRLAICIYYPKEILKKVKENTENIDSWYKETIKRLIRVARSVSRKYTRSKVRKALPEEYSYIIEELLHETDHGGNKEKYYDSVIDNIVDIGIAENFITAVCNVIQRLSIDSLHIVGDIYDRGPASHRIMDELICYHSVDVQWGNHDIVWMGAMCGSMVCIANVIRVCARYGHIDVLEEGYGINLRPLSSFASQTYKNDECTSFTVVSDGSLSDSEEKLLKKMHKAIAIIQFKLEGQIIKRNPEFDMANRLLLDKITKDKKNVEINNTLFALNDNYFPTLDLKHPYELSKAEKELMKRLKGIFMNNEKLVLHINFLFNKGSIYLKYNNNLLLHGCIPMNEDGSFAEMNFAGQTLSGRKMLDYLEDSIRKSYEKREEKDNNTDMFWYLWLGDKSPLFGKDEMKTFERYFIDDIKTHKEDLNPYYDYWEKEKTCMEILNDFNLTDDFSHIINGHVPVRANKGENPIKANGMLIVIDGGLNPIYNPVTGTAGYTLIYDSFGLVLAAHERFVSKCKIVDSEHDIVSYYSQCDRHNERIMVKDTDIGKRIAIEIRSLEKMLDAYKHGTIKEE